MRITLAVGGAIVQPLARLYFRHAVCRMIGHDAQWWLGVSCHGHDGPVCGRCGLLL